MKSMPRFIIHKLLTIDVASHRLLRILELLDFTVALPLVTREMLVSHFDLKFSRSPYDRTSETTYCFCTVIINCFYIKNVKSWVINLGQKGYQKEKTNYNKWKIIRDWLYKMHV